MKKVLSVLFALMILSVCFAASGEEPDLFGIDATIPAEGKELPAIEMAQQSFAPGIQDIVSKNDTKYTVVAPECTYVLDVSSIPSAMILTQDQSVSFDAYICLNNPAEIQKMMVENGLHYVILDIETNLEIDIFSSESDNLSELVGDLNTLSEANRNTVISVNGMDGAKEIGGRYWLYKANATKGIYFTIYNKVPICAQFNGESLEDDMIDTETMLANLILR